MRDFAGFKRIMDVIENLIDNKIAKFESQAYLRGVVASVSGSYASVYIGGNSVATENIPFLAPPVVGDTVLIISIGSTGANLCILGSLTSIGWTAPTFENGWVNYGSPFNTAAYMKGPSGIVRLKGLVKNGTAGTTIFTLPQNCWPAGQVLLSTIGNQGVCRIDVQTGGQVVQSVSTNAWVSLDGLTFMAG